MLKTLSLILYVLNLVLSVASILFGAVSWIFMEKWRQFHHFVFISFIVSGVHFLGWMYAWAQMDMFSMQYLVTAFAILIGYIQMNHWQLIIIFMIYEDFVNVFNSDEVKSKYLLACLFAWLLPVIETTVMLFTMDYWWITWSVIAIIELSFVVANVVLCLMIVYKLVRLMMKQKISTCDALGKVLVSTLVFVTAGVVPIVCIIFVICFTDHVIETLLDDPDVAVLPNLVNLLIGNLYFLSMKSHRQLWAECIRRIRTTRATRREL